MRELTFHELDAQLAEQLPSRELMGFLSRSRISVGHSFNDLGSHDANGNVGGNVIINITIIVGNHNVVYESIG